MRNQKGAFICFVKSIIFSLTITFLFGIIYHVIRGENVNPTQLVIGMGLIFFSLLFLLLIVSAKGGGKIFYHKTFGFLPLILSLFLAMKGFFEARKGNVLLGVFCGSSCVLLHFFPQIISIQSFGSLGLFAGIVLNSTIDCFRDFSSQKKKRIKTQKIK